ncbi:hypothetical protein [Marinifilum flexuosum]|uniref:DUF4304 domain-containing protein n=1 Tax=Marinifilum flexuosum TaxID=1117708 RepID=A0A419WN10_9BACT|nr:hypothetical protein [Marinifilum flexuosum]RKD96875.1 hypothetical protein BXY64_3824 [Marinifilum flexuosum]
MHIIKKIKNLIDRKRAIRRIFKDAESLDEVLLDKRLQIFREIVTPQFAEIGLKNWNGKYLWYSDFNNEGIKHVVEYNVFKIFGGSFTYGNCFSTVPSISGSRLVNHRTDKSTKIIYSKRLDGWQKSMADGSPINPDKISTVNEEKFRKSLETVLSKNIPKLKKWFDEKTTLDQNISGLLEDIENPVFEIGHKIISHEYILAFLYKQKANNESATYWINKHFEKSLNNQYEIELIKKRIDS